MNEFYRIAERESQNVKDLMVQAVKEYVDRHGPGNSQTLLGSFAPGGVRSEGQIEADIINIMSRKKEVSYTEIVSRVREAEFPQDRVLPIINRVTKTLIDKGVKIWK